MARTDGERWAAAAENAGRICRKPTLPPAIAGVLGGLGTFLAAGFFWAFEGLGRDLGFRSPGFATLTTCALGFVIPFGAIWIQQRRYQTEMRRAYDNLMMIEKHEAEAEARREERWRELDERRAARDRRTIEPK